MIGEFFEDAKVLNEQERIERLAEAIEARNEKKKPNFQVKLPKKLKKESVIKSVSLKVQKSKKLLMIKRDSSKDLSLIYLGVVEENSYL